jgi:hypothetical protein
MIVHDSCLKFSKKTRFFSDANKALAHPTVRGPPPLKCSAREEVEEVAMVAEQIGGILAWSDGVGLWNVATGFCGVLGSVMESCFPRKTNAEPMQKFIGFVLKR